MERRKATRRVEGIKRICKKGSKREDSNCRGITLMDRGYKMYAKILREMLERQLEEGEKLAET